MTWKRPLNLPCQVWLRFQGRTKNGSPGQWYQIRDVEPDREKECIELMLESFLNDEPLCKALDIRSDPVSRATVRRDWESFVAQGISVACYTEDDGRPKDLVGFNILIVKEKGQQEELYSIEGESWLKLLKTLEMAESLVDVFEHYGVDSYLSCSGLTVAPGHRGQNIGARLLEARKPLCKALGLCVSASIFTAKTSQILAAKCGYQPLATLLYKDMKKHGVDLTHPVLEEHPTAVLGGIKFEF